MHPTPSPGPDCQRFAPLLPLLDAATAQTIRRHMQTCDWCQRDYASYQALDAATRRAFAVVPTQQRIVTPEAILRRVAMESQPHASRRPFVRITTIGIPIIVILLVAGVVLPRWVDHHPASSTTGVLPTVLPTVTPTLGPCVQSVSLDQTPTYSSTSILMMSPDEGWATGVYTPNAGEGPGIHDYGFLLHFHNGIWRQAHIPGMQGSFAITGMSTAAGDFWVTASIKQQDYFFRYHAGQWIQEPLPPGQIGIGGIAMTSATDGWASAAADSHLWHFHNGSWTQDRTIPDFVQIIMLSSTDGWIIPLLGFPPYTAGQILHYDGTSWRTTPGILPAIIFSASFSTPNDGWAGGTGDQFFHFTNNQWVPVTVPVPNSQFNAELAMASPTDGWAGGYQGILRYHNGAWQRVAAPFGPYGAIVGISIVSAYEGWAIGTDLDASGDGQRHTILLHLHNGQWSLDTQQVMLCLGQ
jgi:hypothetical protein